MLTSMCCTFIFLDSGWSFVCACAFVCMYGSCNVCEYRIALLRTSITYILLHSPAQIKLVFFVLCLRFQFQSKNLYLLKKLSNHKLTIYFVDVVKTHSARSTNEFFNTNKSNLKWNLFLFFHIFVKCALAIWRLINCGTTSTLPYALRVQWLRANAFQLLH